MKELRIGKKIKGKKSLLELRTGMRKEGRES